MAISEITTGDAVTVADGLSSAMPQGTTRQFASRQTAFWPAMNVRSGAYRLAAYVLAFVAGAAAMFAANQQRAAPVQPNSEIAMHQSPVTFDFPLMNQPVEQIPVAEPQQHEVAAEIPQEMVVEEPTNVLRVIGITEPAPGRYAKLPLATSQAVAFVDVKPGDRVKKGWQVFSHWESPERLQAVKSELERTKKLADVAKARATAADQNVDRFKKLQDSVATQELQDAQTTAIVRQAEYEAAQLAIAQAESHFTAMEFEFTQAFVTSPIDGVVVSVDVVPGERRQLNGPFRGVTVLDTSVLYCRCLLDQGQLAALQRIGSATTSRTGTLPVAQDGTGKVPVAQQGDQAAAVDGPRQPDVAVTLESDSQQLDATVVWIGVQADAASGNIPVLLEVKNPAESLRSGVRVNVCFASK